MRSRLRQICISPYLRLSQAVPSLSLSSRFGSDLSASKTAWACHWYSKSPQLNSSPLPTYYCASKSRCGIAVGVGGGEGIGDGRAEGVGAGGGVDVAAAGAVSVARITGVALASTLAVGVTAAAKSLSSSPPQASTLTQRPSRIRLAILARGRCRRVFDRNPRCLRMRRMCLHRTCR